MGGDLWASLGPQNVSDFTLNPNVGKVYSGGMLLIAFSAFQSPHVPILAPLGQSGPSVHARLHPEPQLGHGVLGIRCVRVLPRPEWDAP